MSPLLPTNKRKQTKNWPITFKSVTTMKVKKRLRNFSRMKETTETWHINVICYSGLDHFATKDINETIDKTGIGSENKKVVLFNFLILRVIFWLFRILGQWSCLLSDIKLFRGDRTSFWKHSFQSLNERGFLYYRNFSISMK